MYNVCCIIYFLMFGIDIRDYFFFNIFYFILKLLFVGGLFVGDEGFCILLYFLVYK